MKNALLAITLIGTSLCADTAMSSIRVDIPDLPGPQVLRQSYLYAENEELSKVVGAIWVNHKSLATGIALDPYTVLTAAHTQLLNHAETIVFVLDANAQADPNESPCYAELTSNKVIFHETFKHQPLNGMGLALMTDDETGELSAEGIELSQLQNLSFVAFKNSDLAKHSTFRGVDLAILKLEEPLPEGLAYPEILDKDFEIADTRVISLGYGPMFYNDQDNGPIPVTDDPYQKCLRHLIGSKVSSCTLESEHILYGSYKGLFVNGNESFIPDRTMMKIEGLPVGGSSGGPLLVKQKNKHMLAGILSSTYSVNGQLISDAEAREMLAGIVQPIFPTWVDVRFYKAWIQSHMGQIKQ